MPTVEIAGTELNYERAGAGEPLLLIQGMSGTTLAWGRPFRDLLEQSFDVIAFDNRGIGGSARAEDGVTTPQMATDAAALLQALELAPAHVLGISMGGMIAQELALAHPELLRTLTIGASYCGGPGSSLMAEREARLLGLALAAGDRDRVHRATWEINLSPGFRGDESRYEAFAEMARSARVSQKIVGLQAQACVAHDAQDRLGQIETPTLVIHGTEDRVIGVDNGRQIAALIPGARLEILDGVGHMFWWEQPERSAELVREHALAPA